MPVEIRLPELSGGTDTERLNRMQSYLYTLAQQLQIAFDTASQQQNEGSNQVSAALAATQRESPVNFAAIKALILKSAQITQHFQQEIEKNLSGLYVAQSQFGTFRQETQQRIAANSLGIQQQFTNVSRLETALFQLESVVNEVNATIRTGLLAESEDGGSIHGVEIGQQELENGVIRFRKYTRLTADRLSFYDSNDVEVAYISDRRMYVTAADIAQVSADSLLARNMVQMGDYVWEQGADGHLSLR